MKFSGIFKYGTSLALLFIVLSFYSVSANSQQDNKLSYFTKPDSLSAALKQETAYIQTDKDIYMIGEDLWFKVYLLDLQTLAPSLNSNTVYMVLENETDSTSVWQGKIENRYGFACGVIRLDQSISVGNYLLKVFTRGTFFKNTIDYKLVKKIRIKENVVPAVPFEAEPDKKFYMPGDSLKIRFYPISTLVELEKYSIEISLKSKEFKKSVKITKNVKEGETSVALCITSIPADLKAIVVIDYKKKKKSFEFPIIRNDMALLFNLFPEGGEMVYGLSSRVGFKAEDIFGTPLNIKGVLFQDDKPLKKFESIHAGMGFFDFTPINGSKYYIKLLNMFQDTIFYLPKIRSDGYVIHLVDKNSASVTFSITGSGHDGEEVFLRMQHRGKVVSIKRGVLNNELLIKMPLLGLDQGIAEVTLFNSNFVPVAERLLYLPGSKRFFISAGLSKEVYNKREKVELTVKVHDENGLPLNVNLGVSAFDTRGEDPLQSYNILEHCYLSSQIKGRIWDPAYYFNSSVNKTDRENALDLLMLTQGWRRYVWNEENMKETLKDHNLCISDLVRGRLVAVLDVKQDSLLKFCPSVLELFSLDNITYKYNIFTDSAGNFEIDREKMNILANKHPALRHLTYLKYFSGVKIYVENIFDTIKNTAVNNRTDFICAYKNIFAKESVEAENFNKDLRVLNTIIFSDKKHSANDADPLFPEDYVCMNNILNCQRHGPEHPRSTTPKKNGIYGIIHNYNTKTEYYTYIQYPEVPGDIRTVMFNYKAQVVPYTVSKEFYHQQYAEKKEKISETDYRRTLFWDPKITPYRNGETKITFYCSDVVSEYAVRIEGMSNTGLPGFTQLNFAVK